MSTGRLIWLDCLRLLAGVSMVGLHSTADATGRAWPAYEMADRIAPLLLRSVVYIARTELFLIISIFLLLLALDRRPRSYRATIIEQARRLLLPFAFWTLFYAVYSLIKADAFQYSGVAVSQLATRSAWLGFFLLGDVKYHMHFLPTLFVLVLMYPFFRVAVRFPVLGFSVVAFLMLRREADAYLYAQYWGDDVLPYLLRSTKILTYAGYGMFAGAMLGLWQRRPTAAREKWFFAIAVLGGLLFSLKLAATWRTIEMGRWAFEHVPGYWADFLMPVVLFAGCLILGHKSWPTLISRMAPYSFGIYLCHPIFLDLCEIALKDTQASPITQVLFKIGFTLPATVLFVVVLARSRAVGWTIGLGPLPFSEQRNPHLKEAH